MSGTSMANTASGDAVLRSVFLLAAAGVGMSNLDLFVVNVTMADIAKDYAGASLDSLSWVLTAYAVAFAAFLIPAGNYADRVGAKRAYLTGIWIFTLASLACALSPGVWWLVAARTMQAVGAALLTPASLGLIMTLFTGEARGAAIRGWAALGGLAAALGPVLGGVLAHWHWKLAFLINVPVGVVVLLLGARAIPETKPHNQKHAADVLNAILFALAVALSALAILKAGKWEWWSQNMIAACTGSLALLLVFYLRSSRKAVTSLTTELLNIPGLKTLLCGNLIFAVAFGTMLLSISLWLQQVWQLGAMMAGIAIFPGPLMVPLLSSLSGRLAKRFGALNLAAIGCVLFGVGIGWWIWSVRVDQVNYFLSVLPGLLLTGVGVCFTMPTLIGASIALVPPANFSTGAAIVTVVRQIGTVVGVAGLVAFLARNGQHEVILGYQAGWWFGIAASGLTLCICLFASRRKPR
jgi:EmrB/QacA subfamily drug resistance transporter